MSEKNFNEKVLIKIFLKLDKVILMPKNTEFIDSIIDLREQIISILNLSIPEISLKTSVIK